ncbi:MAG: hypothetical protein ACRYG8_03400 [Janthinobacterium lividum]
MEKLRTAQIGRAGELLVQFRLLQLGYDSSLLTTDRGIDLVAYSPSNDTVRTIQVKSVAGEKPSGGTGKPTFDWWVPDDTPATIVALVDIAGPNVWLLTLPEIQKFSKQHSKGRFHPYCYLGDDAPRGAPHVRELNQFALTRERVQALFTSDTLSPD